MKSVYHCYYCDQVSTRKWNLSKHVERKHKGLEDPFKIGKENVLNDPLSQAQNNYDFSRSYAPQIDYSDPILIAYRRYYINYLLKELRKLSTVELGGIWHEIRNFPQFKMDPSL